MTTLTLKKGAHLRFNPEELRAAIAAWSGTGGTAELKPDIDDHGEVLLLHWEDDMRRSLPIVVRPTADGLATSEVAKDKLLPDLARAEGEVALEPRPLLSSQFHQWSRQILFWRH